MYKRQLYDIGLEGAQIEDKVPLTAAEKEQIFVDILPEGPEDDGIAYLSFFVEENEDGKLLVNGEETTQEAVLESVEKEAVYKRQGSRPAAFRYVAVATYSSEKIRT